MDDTCQDVNTFNRLKTPGHINKVAEKTGSFHSLALTGTAQREQGFLGKARSIHFQLINLIKEEHPSPTRFHSLVARKTSRGVQMNEIRIDKQMA